MAKKFLKTLCVFFILSVFALTACSMQAKDESSEKTEIAASFSADFDANYRDGWFSGSVSTNSKKLTTISLTYPETVSGLKITYRGGEMQLERDELVCSADEAYIPTRSLPSVIKSILDGIGRGAAVLAAKNKETQTYNLKTPLGNAVLTVDNGLMKKAEIKEIEFEVKFENIKPIS